VSPSASVIVPTVGGGERLRRMLSSVASPDHQTIVVDNGSRDGVSEAVDSLPGVDVLRLEHNAGYTGAINLGVERADGDIVVFLNDDCVVDPGFVEKIAARIDPGDGVVMAAGVMRDWRDRSLIDSAGMELDQTLLVFDYLNGEPVSRLGGGVADPIGPSGAAAAFDRASFRSVGGFDEGLFAYWEDVDLVLRLRRLGLRCVLVPDAIGDHEHSATLGSGSKRKNYLMGYGRGYVLRKWGVLDGRRTGSVLLREAVLCAGQAVVDRNLAGVRGRFRGYQEAPATERYPESLRLGSAGGGVVGNLARRARRRSRLRGAPKRVRPLRSLAVFHLANTSGPSRSLEAELAWLGAEGSIDVVVPGPGTVGSSLVAGAEVIQADYEALTAPKTGVLGLLREVRSLWHDVRAFRRIIRQRKPELVISVTTMLPAVPIAAWLERVPALVYCGELFDRGYRRGPLRTLANRALAVLTARLSDGIMACSLTVAGQFAQSSARIETVYPPVGERYANGNGAALREELGIAKDAPLVASIGNLTEGRGQDVLIRAMPDVLSRLPNARCVIAGDPFPRPQDVAYRQRLLSLIDELELGDAVTMAGHVEDVADVYAAADVIVNPARFNEPFGRVPFEAAVAGKPAVVTRVGAIPELLRDERSALIVEPDEPYALALAVTRVLSDPQLAENLVTGARAIVENRLTPAHSLAGFRRAVEAAVGRPVGSS
jgi:GT2 family glycosyltransferase/glycosyltransferase involved in cell wall biosynthesis